MEAWLNMLNPGDDVLINRTHKLPCHGVVDRLTSTMIIVDCGKNRSGITQYRRFRNTDGFAVGEDSFYTAALERATPERMFELKRQTNRNHVIHKIKNTSWHVVDDDKLAEINAILTRGT